jgi:hypothetical protein
MRAIEGKTRNVRELLKGVKYAVDYYQRGYEWDEKQIQELVDDLTGKFLDSYRPEHSRGQVKQYGHYFLGSIIVNDKDGKRYIVDGQQRLTSLTLFLIYLRRLQADRPQKVSLDELIFSEQFGEKSFNMAVEEREPAMQALFAGEEWEDDHAPESVQNLLARYDDLEARFGEALPAAFPEEGQPDALPFFTDWLIENVHLVEIAAFTSEDAYTIFETMNDRGKPLNNADMLKGYLLASIGDEQVRTQANEAWKQTAHRLHEAELDLEDVLKAWLRARHASSTRQRKRGAESEDFELIGSEYHRWVRDHHTTLGLTSDQAYKQFIGQEFKFFADCYLLIEEASHSLVPGLEHVLYNAHHGFTLQNTVLLAALRPQDAPEVVRLKLRLVAHYLNILLGWRIWNYRNIGYSALQYNMFSLIQRIRNLTPAKLAALLTELLAQENETMESGDVPRLHGRNRRQLHLLLARLTHYVGEQSGQATPYMELVNWAGNAQYEVEHIWADHFEDHTNDFDNEYEFADYRDRLGGLLLLPKSFNASFGDQPYSVKYGHYFGQNILAKSLHTRCYAHNPGFLRFNEELGEAFKPIKPHPEFRKADQDKRSALYRQLALCVWNAEDILAAAQ